MEKFAQEPKVNFGEKEVKDYFIKLYSELYKNNPELFESIRRYKSDAYYSDVNGVARMGKDEYINWLISKNQKPESSMQRAETASEILNNLEVFFSKSILQKPISVYRKISYKTLDKIKNSQRFFTDPGLVSTSFTLEDANLYHKEFTIRIDIPAGAKVIDMTSALKSTNWSGAANWENELTIDRNYSYEIIPSENKDYELILKLKLQ